MALGKCPDCGEPVCAGYGWFQGKVLHKNFPWYPFKFKCEVCGAIFVGKYSKTAWLLILINASLFFATLYFIATRFIQGKVGIFLPILLMVWFGIFSVVLMLCKNCQMITEKGKQK